MKTPLKVLPLLVALLTSSLFFSCEKDVIETTSETQIATPAPTLATAVERHQDGSYSYDLTGAELAGILRDELGEDTPTDPQAMLLAFSDLVEKKEAKPGLENSKRISYSFRYRVETVLEFGDPIEDWIITGGGTGGVMPGFTPSFNLSTRQARTQRTFHLMTASADVNDNQGNGVFSDTDSSFDIGVCFGNRFDPRGIIGTSHLNWSINGTITGDANVTCGSLRLQRESEEVECC